MYLVNEILQCRLNFPLFWHGWSVQLPPKYACLLTVSTRQTFITARMLNTTGGYVFYRRLSVNRRGVPHLHPISLPLVPCPFWGVPHLHPIILPLVPCPFWGVPHWLVLGPFLRVPQSWCWVPQSQEGLPMVGYPPARSRWGTPPGLGYPSSEVKMGHPTHQDRLFLDRLCHGLYSSCGFQQEDCPVTW